MLKRWVLWRCGSLGMCFQGRFLDSALEGDGKVLFLSRDGGRESKAVAGVLGLRS